LQGVVAAAGQRQRRKNNESSQPFTHVVISL
jgi:hypothetical protein